MQHKGILAVFLVAVLAAGAASPGAPEKGLPDYQKIFADQTKRIETNAEAERAAGLEMYGKALDLVRERLRVSGNLEGLLAVDNEINRFKLDKTVPEADAEGLHPGVAVARAGYRQSQARVEAMRVGAHVNLIQKYIVPLKDLKRQYTVLERIDDALKVDAEIKRVEFLLADYQSKIPKPATVPAKKQPGTRPPATVPAVAGNLVKNGSFESGNTEGWDHWALDKTDTEVIDAEARTGKYSVKYGEYRGISQTVKTMPGTQYRASYWIKVVDAGNGQIGGICIDVPRGNEERIEEPCDWTERSIRFKASKPEHTITVWMNKALTAYIDDVTVVPVK